MRELSIAIIGANGIAYNHGNAIEKMPGLRFAACCDVNEAGRTNYAERYKIRPYADYQKLVEEEKPDIVIIATPDELHCEQAVFCAAHKCNLLIQKPFATNIAEAERIIAAVTGNGVKAKSCQNYRYTSKIEAAKRIIDEGRIGAVKYIRVSSPASPFWTQDKWNYPSRGRDWLLVHNGMHQFDYLFWMLGSMPRLVYTNWHDGQDWLAVAEYVQVFMELENGALVESVENRIMQPAGYPFHQDFFAVGTRGAIDLSDVETHSMFLWTKDGMSYPGAHASVRFQNDPFVKELAALETAIRTGGEVDIPLTFSLHVLKALLATVASMTREEAVTCN